MDYLILSTLHDLTKKSIYSLHRAFEEELVHIPSNKDIELYRINVKLVLHPEEIDSEASDDLGMKTEKPTSKNNANVGIF